MPRRFIDISVPLEDVPTNPPHHRPKIEYQNHDNSWDGFRRYYPGVKPEEIVDGKAWASETVTLLTHSGTHLDAPWHYHPTMNHRLKPGGEPAAIAGHVTFVARGTRLVAPTSGAAARLAGCAACRA